MSLIAKQLLIYNIGLPTEIRVLINDYTFPRINKIPKNDRRYRMIYYIILRIIKANHLLKHSPRLIDFILPGGIELNEVNHCICLKCPRSEEREFDINLVKSFCLIYTDLAMIMIKIEYTNRQHILVTFLNNKDLIDGSSFSSFSISF